MNTDAEILASLATATATPGSDWVDISDLTDADVIRLMEGATVVDDAYLAGRLAELGEEPADVEPAAPVIERDDTVRFPGRRARWVVEMVYPDGDLEISYFRKTSRTTSTYRSRRVARDSVEFVRKGNATDEANAKFLAEVDAMRAPVQTAPGFVVKILGRTDGDSTRLAGRYASSTRGYVITDDEPARAQRFATEAEALDLFATRFACYRIAVEPAA